MGKTSIYWPKRYEQLLKRFNAIAKREGRSMSKILSELILCYVQQHEEGNPQRPLVPEYEEPIYVLEAFPIERRYDNMEWLKSLIARNPGRPPILWTHKFSEITGLQPKTVREYIKTLLITGSIIQKGGKLYTRDQVPP